MSQVSLLVIKPSNIKLILKSHSLFFCKVSFIADTCHFFFSFLGVDTFHFPSDNISVSFQGIAFPNVRNLGGN